MWTRHNRLVLCGLIFIFAFCVRLLAWQDNRFEATRVQSAVTEGYRHTGRLLREGGLGSFFSRSSLLADPNHLGHPPGYPLLLAATSIISQDPDSAAQFFQITADSIAAVIIFLLACSLLNASAATTAGLLVALAPQFTYNSTLLLPDSLSVLPLLLAAYCLARAERGRARIARFVLAGALIGVSCWLRANAMLLAPFMALSFLFLFERGRRRLYALALVGGTLLVIAPLTVRNYIVYEHFVPVSLGAGQTLLEGIADYDRDGRFGIPATDMGIMKSEAELYHRPDYYGTLFNPDGIKRERLRLRRGFSVIGSHPFWFASVMIRRAGSMLRLERVRNVSAEPPVAHSLTLAEGTQPVLLSAPADLLIASATGTPQVELSLTTDGQMLNIRGDDSKYGAQLLTAPFRLEAATDYLVQLPVRIEQGRMTVEVVGANSGEVRASAVVEPEDWKSPAEQTVTMVRIPFVNRGTEPLRIVFANAGSQSARSIVQVGEIEVYALGPSERLWLRYPRIIVNLIQRLFITAVMLPLALCGLTLLVLRRERRALALLLTVPLYYLCFQSALHTEYRYVMAIHYFLFVAVAISLDALGRLIRRGLSRLLIMRRLQPR